jgi:hypothetical protein
VGAELLAEVLQVLGPLAEHQAVPAPVERVQDIGADDRGAVVVLDKSTEHLMDGPLVGICGSVVGLMDDELARHGRAGGGGQRDLMAGRAAVHGDDGLEPVAAVGVAVSPIQRRAGICLTHASKVTAGTWWHSSTITSP